MEKSGSKGGMKIMAGLERRQPDKDLGINWMGVVWLIIFLMGVVAIALSKEVIIYNL